MGPLSAMSVEYRHTRWWYSALLLQLYVGIPFDQMMSYSSLIIPILVEMNPDLREPVNAKVCWVPSGLYHYGAGLVFLCTVQDAQTHLHIALHKLCNIGRPCRPRPLIPSSSTST